MGLISGALGGLGQALQYQAQMGMQNDAAMERDARQNVATEQRDIRQTKLREELEAKRAETIEANRTKADERNAGIYIKAADAAPAAGDERRFQRFKADIGQTDATEDQLRTVFKNQYNQRSVGNFGGADRYSDKASANSMDIVDELRRTAAPATMIMSAQKDYQSRLDAERKETIDALSLRRQEDKELSGKEERRIDARRVEVLAAKGAGGGSGSDTKEWLGVIGEQRKGLAAELADLRKTRDAKLEATPDPRKKQAIIESFDAQIATAKEAGRKIDEKIEAVTSRLVSRDGAPKMPKPDGSTTKPVMQPVRVNGKEIGQAASQEEATALVAKWKSAQKKQ